MKYGRRQGEGFPVPGFRTGSGRSSERRSRALGACQNRIPNKETRGRPPLRRLGAFMKSQLWKGFTGTGSRARVGERRLFVVTLSGTGG